MAILDANGLDGGNAEQQRNERRRQSGRHIRQLAHINLTWLPLLSRADRSKTLVGSVRQIDVARVRLSSSRSSLYWPRVVRPSVAHSPVPVSPPFSAARRPALVVARAAHTRCSVCARWSCLHQPRASWESACRCGEGTARRRRFNPQSVGLSVSARSIFISTLNAINLRHRALLRREQASQRPGSRPLSRCRR